MTNVSQSSTATPSATVASPWRSVGVWMTIFLIVYILFNAVRSVLNPADFAVSFGLPLTSVGGSGFVFVYAIRALFLGLFGIALLVRRNYSGLALFVLVASVMPIGDATLVSLAGGPTGTVIRHIVTAGFLLLTWFFIRRWMQVHPRHAD